MAANRINAWHVCISGFTQHHGRMSGLMRLWLLLSAAIASRSVRVELRPWREDWPRFAEWLWLTWQEQGGPPPTICVYAYSYGAGWGFLRLADELGKRGMEIHRAVLCDPVYRHGYLWGAWRAFWPFSRICVPASVREVWWFYQRRNLPMGHQVVAANRARTLVHAGQEIVATHQYVDDSESFREQCLEAAGVE
jgi:hypothetical protein